MRSSIGMACLCAVAVTAGAAATGPELGLGKGDRAAIAMAASDAAPPRPTGNENGAIAKQPAGLLAAVAATTDGRLTDDSQNEDLRPGSLGSVQVPQSATSTDAEQVPKSTAAESTPPTTEQLCTTLAQAAEHNEIPVPFFLRLIWQESRFDPNSVSHAGAQGVAQFMPEAAAEMGLVNPFEPIEALRASARFLRSLREQFGNLGLAAAAYNAGARRIRDWLAKRGSLPAETRNYVLKITGHAPERWVASKAIDLPVALPAEAPCEGVAGLSRKAPPLTVPALLTDGVTKLIAEAAQSKAKRTGQSFKAKMAAKRNGRKRLLAHNGHAS